VILTPMLSPEGFATDGISHCQHGQDTRHIGPDVCRSGIDEKPLGCAGWSR